MESEKIPAAAGSDHQESIKAEPISEKKYGQSSCALPSIEPTYLHGWRLHLTTLGYVSPFILLQ